MAISMFKYAKLFGTDKLLGTDGDDLFISLGFANTTMDGGAGNDVLIGGAGKDVLMSGKGIDFLNGGAGVDTADYSTSKAAVRIDLGLHSGSGGDAEGDTLVEIENVTGSAYNDTLIGNEFNNALIGGAGNDKLIGG